MPRHVTQIAVENVMRLFRCPYCEAEPGQACITKSGMHCPVAHAGRYYVAVDAGALPLTGEEHRLTTDGWCSVHSTEQGPVYCDA
jgi:hypothetical protein